MKTFKQFNENFKDLLTGKSEEDIKKSLENLSNTKKIELIYKHKLPLKYLPLSINKSKELIIKNIKNIITHYEDGIIRMSLNHIIIKEETDPSIFVYEHRVDEVKPNGILVGVYDLEDYDYVKSYNMPFDKINIEDLVRIYGYASRDYEEELYNYYSDN